MFWGSKIYIVCLVWFVMEVSKRWVVIFVLVVVLLVGFVGFGINFDEVGITGNVVDIYSPVSCEDSEIFRVWDDVFVESSFDMIFFVNGSVVSGACAGFLGYKIDGNEVRGIVFRRSVDSFGKISDVYWVSYSNLLSGWVSNVSSIVEFNSSNIELLTLVLSSLDTAQDRSSVLEVDDISAEFSSKFLIDDGSWVEKTNTFEFDVENSSSDFNDEAHGVVFSGKDGALYTYSYVNLSDYDVPVNPVLDVNVGNLTFEWNSGWNVGFNFSDYFSYPIGSVFSFVYTGANNSGGEWINYSIVGDEVKFKPKSGFLGSRKFRVGVKSYLATLPSNTFNVEIVEHINRAPVLITDFETISLVEGDSFTLYLDIYFEDPDGDNLTYRASGLDNVIVSFSGDEATVSLGTNFSYYDSFRIYASDGDLERISNKIWVVEANSPVLPAGLVNSSVDNSVDNSTVAPENGSANGDSQQEEEGDGSFWFWFWIVLGGISVLLIVGVVVYFFVFDKDSVVPSGGVNIGQNQSASVNPVNSYLSNLNLPKR